MAGFGYVVGTAVGIILVLCGTLFLIGAFIDTSFTSWFGAFFAMFIYIIAAIVFFAANKAKPKKVVV